MIANLSNGQGAVAVCHGCGALSPPVPGTSGTAWRAARAAAAAERWTYEPSETPTDRCLICSTRSSCVTGGAR